MKLVSLLVSLLVLFVIFVLVFFWLYKISRYYDKKYGSYKVSSFGFIIYLLLIIVLFSIVNIFINAFINKTELGEIEINTFIIEIYIFTSVVLGGIVPYFITKLIEGTQEKDWEKDFYRFKKEYRLIQHICPIDKLKLWIIKLIYKKETSKHSSYYLKQYLNTEIRSSSRLGYFTDSDIEDFIYKHPDIDKKEILKRIYNEEYGD